MAGGVLDADMGQLRRSLAAGLAWWVAELTALVPSAVRSRSATPLLLHPPVGEGGWRVTRNGREVPVGSRAASRPGAIALPVHRVLLRRLRLPAMPAADLRRMLEFDLDRLTPFAAGTAIFDFERLGRGVDGKADVLVGAMSLGDAMALRANAISAGFAPVRMAVAVPGEPPRLDLLRGLPGSAATGSAMRGWWLAVMSLVLANVLMLIGRDVVATSRFEVQVDAAAPAGNAAHMLQARLQRERRRWDQALALRVAHEPLRVVGAISTALPAGAWVQRLSFDGSTVRLAGYRTPGTDVLAGLRRSPLLMQVHATGGDGAPQATSAQPYDVSALVRRP